MEYNERRLFLRSKRWRVFRQQIIERDDSICRCCGTITKKPKIHHLIQDKTKYDILVPDNFITLCSACHDYISAMIPRKKINEKIRELIAPYYK
jgi:5-methylcytosine-specific restriction endonuclease McrA